MSLSSQPATVRLVDDLVARLDSLERWNAARRETAARAARPRLTREDRLDGARELEVRERELDVFLERLDTQDPRVWGRPDPQPVAVVAHRHEWLRRQVVTGLREQGIDVVVETDNGADVLGVVLAERPGVVVVDELLAMRTGLDTVRELRTVAPLLPIAATVAFDEGVAAMLDAGATAVFTRRTPPADLVDELAVLARAGHVPPVGPQRPSAIADDGVLTQTG